VRLPAKSALLPLLLFATATGAWGAAGPTPSVDGPVVDVQSMIGEAVIIRKGADGQTSTIVIPTGKTTQTDPATGETAVEESTVHNRVNDVVRAIAAASPDALGGSTSEGCSGSSNPIRPTANPAHDPNLEAEIRKMLADLSEGELMMVIAVLNNNARHLCIDSGAVNSAVGQIATVRPDAAAQVVFVAALVDPANAEQYTATAQTAAPSESSKIQQASAEAQAAREEFGTDTQPSQPTDSGESPPPEDETPAESEDPGNTQPDVPPGGAPSPE